MAFGLQYTVYGVAAEVPNGPVLNENVVAVTGSSVQSGVMDSAGGNRTRRVRLFADTACFVTWGADPTALTDGTEGRAIGIENPEFVEIRADHVLGVIQRT